MVRGFIKKLAKRMAPRRPRVRIIVPEDPAVQEPAQREGEEITLPSGEVIVARKIISTEGGLIKYIDPEGRLRVAKWEEKTGEKKQPEGLFT